MKEKIKNRKVNNNNNNTHSLSQRIQRKNHSQHNFNNWMKINWKQMGTPYTQSIDLHEFTTQHIANEAV